jgi:phosphoribosylaminoimidazolecarboxamide formyltransferase/IMP cyclohydrolase
MSLNVWIQVTDTTNLEILAKDLIALGGQLYAEGKSFKFLEQADVPVHKGKSQDWHHCDLLVANLFGHGCPLRWDEEAEHDDDAVSALHQASHRNAIPVLVSPRYYAEFVRELKLGGLEASLIAELKVQSIRHLAYYHARLDEHLSKTLKNEEVLHLEFVDGVSLRYGENAHQAATFYREPCHGESSLANAVQLHGKELSYNNIVDADAALEMVREFADQNAVAIIKHLNPAGLATGETLAEAFEAAWSGDPVSAFGSVIAVSSKVDLATAELLKGRFVEILLAPGFDDDALDFLKNKSKDIRILEIKNVEKPRPGKVLKHVIGGLLVQDRDVATYEKWDVVTQTAFPQDKQALAEFTWIVTKHTKSNAIVMGWEYKPGYYQVMGLGPGQPNRIDSNLRLCQPRVRDNVARLPQAEGLDAAGLQALETEIFGQVVMGSDAFFPFSDNIEAASAAGVKFIVSPGGSVRDSEVIAKADELGVALVFTGTRHFRH